MSTPGVLSLSRSKGMERASAHQNPLPRKAERELRSQKDYREWDIAVEGGSGLLSMKGPWLAEGCTLGIW